MNAVFRAQKAENSYSNPAEDFMKGYNAATANKVSKPNSTINSINSLNSTNFKKYKYLVLENPCGQSIRCSYGIDVERNLFKWFKGKSLPVYVRTSGKFKTHSSTPQELRDNPRLGIYLTAWKGYVNENVFDVKGYFILKDYDGNILFSDSGRSTSFRSITKNFVSFLKTL